MQLKQDGLPYLPDIFEASPQMSFISCNKNHNKDDSNNGDAAAVDLDLCTLSVSVSHRPSRALPLLLLDTQKTNLTLCLLCLSLFPFSLPLYGTAFGFLLLCACMCVHVGVWETVREHITISSLGSHDQPNPPKILSNAAIFVQPALTCAPCCTPNIADGRESPAWFPKTTPGAQILALVFGLFSFFFFSMRQKCWCKIFVVTGNVK